MWFIKPLQNVIGAIPQSLWEEHLNNLKFMDGLIVHHLFKNIWVCHDTKAKYIQTRWFFVRVKGDNE